VCPQAFINNMTGEAGRGEWVDGGGGVRGMGRGGGGWGGEGGAKGLNMC